MTYTYGLHGAPAVGGGLPGLPQRRDSGGNLQRSTYTRIVTPGSGVIEPPEGAKFMRVAVIGGGGGASSFGGGGGGCAASDLVAVSSVKYTVGAGGTPNVTTSAGNGGTSSAAFGDRELKATGGARGQTSPVAGGVGTGGDYNFSGGSVTSTIVYACPGAGGAGPRGNGGAFNSAAAPYSYPGEVSDSGWGVGGGGSGSARSLNTVCAAGGGAGSPGATFWLTGESRLSGGAAHGAAWGTTPSIATRTESITGGDMGGGGARTYDSAYYYGPGGPGGIVVEWFY